MGRESEAGLGLCLWSREGRRRRGLKGSSRGRLRSRSYWGKGKQAKKRKRMTGEKDQLSSRCREDAVTGRIENKEGAG